MTPATPWAFDWAILAPLPDWGDVGPLDAVVVPHGYLWCYCGHQLWVGETVTGAGVLCCRACRLVVDQRRVA